VFHFGSVPDIHKNLSSVLKGLPGNHCCQFFLTLILASEGEYFVGDRPECEFSGCIGLQIINLYLFNISISPLFVTVTCD
jgi:hypothetical protein